MGGKYMSEIKDTDDVDKPDEVNSEGAETSEVDKELDNHYNEYIEKDKSKEFKFKDGENIKINCINERLEGKNHPETGVSYEKREVEVDGKNFEVVVPNFESSYDAQLPRDLYKNTDRQHKIECNKQLKSEIEDNEKLREKFTPDELEMIENEDTPDGYTWHHDADEGKMQLVDTEKHEITRHTGGRAIWGGGTENR